MTPPAHELEDLYVLAAHGHHAKALRMACVALAEFRETFDRIRHATSHGILRLPPMSACEPDGPQEASDSFEVEGSE